MSVYEELVITVQIDTDEPDRARMVASDRLMRGLMDVSYHSGEGIFRVVNVGPRFFPWNPANGWYEHPTHSREAWQDEVANDDTVLGYVDWVNHRLEQDEEPHER